MSDLLRDRRPYAPAQLIGIIPLREVTAGSSGASDFSIKSIRFPALAG